jgi:hypothetical protein
MTPCFKARIGRSRVALGQRHEEVGSALLLAQGTEALGDFAMRGGGECEDLRDLRMPLHSGRDLSSVSKSRQV